MEADICISFSENLTFRFDENKIAHFPAFWRILVGNGKWGRPPDATLKASKDRRANVVAQFHPVKGDRNVQKPFSACSCCAVRTGGD
ncbi:MAG: hypothetical protein ACXW4Q_13135, partial [Anaerolineales bacterium]